MSFGEDLDRDPSERLRWAFVRLLPLLALFLFVAIVIDPGRSFAGDELPLVAASKRLLQGSYAVVGTMQPVQFLWHGPGLPAFLAPLVALGTPLAELRLLTPLLMFAAVLLFNRLLGLRLGPRPALAGAYSLGLYFPAYYVFGTVAKEPLALLLSVLLLYGTARYLHSGSWRHCAVAGLALASLAMTRLEYGWATALMLMAGLIWLLSARGRYGPNSEHTVTAKRWTTICAVAMAACTPWLAYTYSLTGRLFYWGNSGGSSLFWMSSPSRSQFGQWYSAQTVFHSPALAAYRPLFHQLATLTPLQRDLTLRHLAVVQALGHPAKYALNIIANVGRMLIAFPFSFHVPDAAVAALAIVNGMVLIVLIASAVRVLRGQAALPRVAVPFAIFAIAGFSVHLFGSATPRMLVPVMPVPIWLVAQALKDWQRAPFRVPLTRHHVRLTRQRVRQAFGLW